MGSPDGFDFSESPAPDGRKLFSRQRILFAYHVSVQSGQRVESVIGYGSGGIGEFDSVQSECADYYSLILVPNWILAVLIGLMVLGGSVGLYVRALKSTGLGDDILTLLALYLFSAWKPTLSALAKLVRCRARAICLLAIRWWVFGF